VEVGVAMVDLAHVVDVQVEQLGCPVCKET
jgi:hypothetical protein